MPQPEAPLPITPISKALQFLPPIIGDTRWLEEIRNRYRWLLLKGGVPMAFFQRKVEGTRCSHCWDAKRQQTTDPKCTYCWNTGYTGGYHGPYEIWISLVSPQQQEIQRSEFGQWRERNAKSWTVWDPMLHSRDLLVTKTNERYEIVSATPTKWRDQVLRQDLDLKLLQASDIVYSIPIY